MDISVILCTYNRAESLAKALGSIAASTFSHPAEWEIVVVDNNSHDQTRSVVERFAAQAPVVVRYVFEPQQGLSQARNTGIRESRGQILAFTDDDVTVDPAWLENLTTPLYNGAWSGASGRTLSAGNFVAPSWLAMEGPYSMGVAICARYDFGDQPRPVEAAPYGANMAYRRSMFEKYGGFRVDLERRPGWFISCEDTEFGRRLMKAGERLRYEPSAVVHHEVPANRMNEAYLLGWWHDFGRVMIREQGCGRPILGVPRPLFSILRNTTVELPKRTWRWLRARNPQERFYHKCWVWVTFGQIKEWWQML